MDEYIRYYSEERIKVKLKGLTPLKARNQALSLNELLPFGFTAKWGRAI